MVLLHRELTAANLSRHSFFLSASTPATFLVFPLSCSRLSFFLSLHCCYTCFHCSTWTATIITTNISQSSFLWQPGSYISGNLRTLIGCTGSWGSKKSDSGFSQKKGKGICLWGRRSFCSKVSHLTSVRFEENFDCYHYYFWGIFFLLVARWLCCWRLQAPGSLSLIQFLFVTKSGAGAHDLVICLDSSLVCL
jgi:hypothetical protein